MEIIKSNTQNKREQLETAIRQRILILDGAMGTMIQACKLTEEQFRGNELADVTQQLKGNNDLLNITQPKVIEDIHRRYLLAGADIVATNTFSSQRISQADYGLEHLAARMAKEGAVLARRVVDEVTTTEHPRWVAGAIGPTNKTLSMSPDVANPAARDLTYDTLLQAYKEQVEALMDGGVDLLLVETIFDTLNAKCALDAAQQVMDERQTELPIMLSATVTDLSGRTLSGQTLDAFLASVTPYNVFSVGLNCSFGARQMMPFLRTLARRAPQWVSCYPNAGLPNSLGEYDESAETMAPQVEEMMREGLVNIMGGCCGTTEEFIRLFRQSAQGVKPRVPAPAPSTLWLSGLEWLNVTPEVRFVNIGERCNVAGSRKFLRLIEEKKYEEAQVIARKQVEDGALVLDVNMDDGLLDAPQEMEHFLNLVASEPDIARVPIMVDSSKWEVIRAGLHCLQGKSIVNSISLKEGEEEFLQRAREAQRAGAAVVVMCFDEEGQATSYERRIEIAERSYRLLTEQVGMNALDIIFDPNVLAICTGMKEHDSYALDFIRATEWIRKNLKGAHVSGGVSNLSFSFRGNNYIREAMHAVFLFHAIQAGMDFGIVNPASRVTYQDIPQEQLQLLEDVILNRREGASEELIELAERIKEEAEVAKSGGNAAAVAAQEAWREEALEDRLQYALRKGISSYLNDDLHEALEKYAHAVDIIEGPLMDGMNVVGELFGDGKMFLPQVVKTARTMKDAVAILQPYIEAEKVEGTEGGAGRMVMATVKGDVHDIGKNIVGVVMGCNNYEIRDLGVMVPAETIIQTAKDCKADLVGLSGLITPSLDEMVHVARAMEEEGMRIPILVGGATTSKMHAALKIAPEYSGPVVWTKDAAQCVLACSALLNPEQRDGFLKKLYEEYEQLRQQYYSKQVKMASLQEARANKLDLWSDN